MDNDLAALFQQGVDDYWAGYVPKGWNKESKRLRSPYLMGWWMSGEFDNAPDLFNDRNR